MKLRVLWQAPAHLAMIAFAAVFLTHLDLYLEAAGQWPIPMLAVNVCFVVVIGLVAGTFLQAAGSAAVRQRVIRLYRANVRVLLPLAMIVVGSFMAAFSKTAYLEVGPRYVLYPAYTATLFVCSMLLLVPRYRQRWFTVYLFTAFAVTVGGILWDVVHPGTFSILPDRAAGFARNPNGGGFLVIALSVGLLSFERVRLFDLLVLVATTAAAIATLSRGAMLLVAFVTMCYAACVVRSAWKEGVGRVLRVVGGLGLLVCITGAGTIFLISQRMFASPGSRVDMLLGREQAIGPNESRVELLEYSIQLARESPIFVYGSGFTARMAQGPHNMYVSRWLDDGLVGMLSYIWLLLALAWTFWKRRYIPGMVFTAVLMAEGFFSHNIYEERAFLILPGLLLSASFFAMADIVPAPAERRLGTIAVTRKPSRQMSPPSLSA